MDRTRLGRRILAATAVLAATVACDQYRIPEVCTLIGCTDQVRVLLEPAAALPYRVRASFPAGQVVSFLCSASGVSEQTGQGVGFVTCDASRFTITCAQLNSFCSASPVNVEVTPASGATRSGRLSPRFESFQPNGPGCGPSCSSGTATLP